MIIGVNHDAKCFAVGNLEPINTTPKFKVARENERERERVAGAMPQSATA